ncbi:alpha/beta hydrolase [Sporomusa acidovorans]|uniref:Acetyl esterase n=1 Tax=Sporomusa acidovorans (strain ATCC 49682 / DSM 3132 / Mol) TaxID=1123286 RepID=A0ABZ3J5N8_SPOA4|nr:alpha/beta hydrolase [Sporomusa acidovorans]OZC23510.1 acetyl esterase [Sporomusa acidovorans DSM 3132]SDF47824.1 Acetyl esterase/lipase [Sporomusa acidovorans]
MNFKKSIGIIAMTGLLMTGLVGSVSAADSNADSKTLDFPITEPTVRLISNVIYEQVPSRGYDNVAMGMDVLKPERNEKMPAIVFVTGGGFINANKDNCIQQRMDMANAGYVVASITYRVAPTATFPQPLEDVKAAIRYLRAHADKFNINPKKIGIMGGSAGGYLSAMAGTTNGTKQFDKGEYLNQSSDVQAVVDFYGLSDLTRVGADYSEKVQEAHKSPGATEALWVNGSPVFGGKDGGILVDSEKAKAANPITYISDKTAPFLLMHGDKDTVVSPSQTELLHQALIAHGIEATRYIVKGAQHGGVYWNQPEVMQKVIDFFDKHLK